MRWLPPWLAKIYANLYTEKRTKVFEFSEAGKIVGVGDKRLLAISLGRLRRFGHLTVRRDPADPRRKLFRLIDPESIVRAFYLRSRAESSEIRAKLRSASGILDYYVNGSHAAYQYHRYRPSGSVDLAVRPEQLPVWMAFLSERDVAISVDDLSAERPGAVNVRLHSGFDKKWLEHAKLRDGIWYLSPEALVVTGLIDGNPSLEDVLAILVVRRKDLDWRTLLDLADSYGAARFLGCFLEVLNLESGKRLFAPGLVAGARTKSKLGARVDFPASMKAEPVEERYSEVASRWNLRLHVNRAAVSKIITDLVRA